MATRKYIIIDDDGNPTGHILLKDETPTFEHTSPTLPFQTNGPAADAALLFASLTGFTVCASIAVYLASGPMWIGPTVGTITTAALAAIKAYRSGVTDQPQEPASQELTIKVEAWGEDRLIILEEIRDKTISLDDWRKVAKAIVFNNCNFSRPALCKSAGISQTTYHKIKDEFDRLRFAHNAPGNKTVLSPRAFSFLRKIYELPY